MCRIGKFESSRPSPQTSQSADVPVRRRPSPQTSTLLIESCGLVQMYWHGKALISPTVSVITSEPQSLGATPARRTSYHLVVPMPRSCCCRSGVAQFKSGTNGSFLSVIMGITTRGPVVNHGIIYYFLVTGNPWHQTIPPTLSSYHVSFPDQVRHLLYLPGPYWGKHDSLSDKNYRFISLQLLEMMV